MFCVWAQAFWAGHLLADLKVGRWALYGHLRASMDIVEGLEIDFGVIGQE